MDGVHLLRDTENLLRTIFPFLFLISIGSGCDGDRVPDFDAERAFLDLERQCEFGPRVPGSEAHRRMEDWLVSILQSSTDEVVVDTFSLEVDTDPIPVLRNYIARINPDSKRRILLSAHYDTRPVADRDPDVSKRDQPILGANDGASGVAVLIELARQFHERRPKVGVDLVFFDGEDYGEDADRMLLGSRRFAAENSDYRPLFGILVDMVGDRDLNLYQEIYSVQGSPETVRRVWSLAGQLGFDEQFISYPRYAVMDDHVPLLEAGIRCINIIDFDYPYWHTTGDTPDKCSAESLEIVGTVLLHLVYGLDS
jgi:hypothetical protein